MHFWDPSQWVKEAILNEKWDQIICLYSGPRGLTPPPSYSQPDHKISFFTTFLSRDGGSEDYNGKRLKLCAVCNPTLTIPPMRHEIEESKIWLFLDQDFMATVLSRCIALKSQIHPIALLSNLKYIPLHCSQFSNIYLSWPDVTFWEMYKLNRISRNIFWKKLCPDPKR